MANSVQEAIAAALAGNSGTQTTQNAAVRTVNTDSLKTTSKSGR